MRLRSARRLPWHRERLHARRRFSARRWWATLAPSRLLLISFATLIAVGTCGFRWLPGLHSDAPLSWVDALFMATSAVCVTGLAVVNPATDFTFVGQLWTLVLMQLGGLGLLTFTTGIMLSVGRRLSLRHEELVLSAGEARPEVDYRTLIRRVLRFTLAIELGGFVLLYGAWLRELGPVGALWPAFFHAISAFCNSGLSVFADAAAREEATGFGLLVLTALVLCGSLGFLVLSELALGATWRGPRRRRLSLHTRIVLAATLAALLITTTLFAVLEWNHTLADMSYADKLLNALFAGGASRTAGFATVDFGAVTAPTALATMVGMFIGGAPGSTAGGIKLTTVAILVLLASARLRGRRYVSAFDRTIPDETLGRAVGVSVIGVAVLLTALFALIAADPRATSHDQFLRYMFEAVSAFGTAGLSMNLTSELSQGGRMVIIVLMFIGRVGVMTLAAALTLERRALPFRYAKEDVAIG